MPGRRKRENAGKVPGKRALRDMLICAVCGAPVEAVRTSGGSISGVCHSCGHVTVQDAESPVADPGADESAR
jgi:hypothetical protein